MVEITSYEKKIKKHLSFLGFVRVENKYKQEFATKEEALTVDHILSIRKAQKSKFLQWILLKMNLDDINDSKNLCACCKKCNQKKGQKVSAAYVVRGILSRKRWFWITYYLLILIIIIWVIYNIGNI